MAGQELPRHFPYQKLCNAEAWSCYPESRNLSKTILVPTTKTKHKIRTREQRDRRDRKGRKKEREWDWVKGKGRRHPLSISINMTTFLRFAHLTPPIFSSPILLAAKHLFYPVLAANNPDPLQTKIKQPPLKKQNHITLGPRGRVSANSKPPASPAAWPLKGKRAGSPSRWLWQTGLQAVPAQSHPTSSP